MNVDGTDTDADADADADTFHVYCFRFYHGTSVDIPWSSTDTTTIFPFNASIRRFRLTIRFEDSNSIQVDYVTGLSAAIVYN